MIDSKDYRLSGFPNEKLAGRASLTYGEYIEWLADFLYQADMEIGESQKKMFAAISDFDPDGAMWSIGTDAGLNDFESSRRPFYSFPDDFDIDKAEPIYPDILKCHC